MAENNSIDTNEVSTNNFAEMSEVDIAYKLLTEAGKENPVYFKTLIRTIIKLKGKTVQNEAATISEIYTMINMDSRFQHMGDGRWGLADWTPPETKRSSRTRSTSSKTTA
ncbi:MAG: DNA-directed RNA polymerase subunit delta [Selenomonadaceae bacterium]|nr:DNA-directed RNA polymerase subunit delta [Selenomonadaceae bacterium]